MTLLIVVLVFDYPGFGDEVVKSLKVVMLSVMDIYSGVIRRDGSFVSYNAKCKGWRRLLKIRWIKRISNEEGLRLLGS